MFFFLQITKKNHSNTITFGRDMHILTKVSVFCNNLHTNTLSFKTVLDYEAITSKCMTVTMFFHLLWSDNFSAWTVVYMKKKPVFKFICKKLRKKCFIQKHYCFFKGSSNLSFFAFLAFFLKNFRFFLYAVTRRKLIPSFSICVYYRLKIVHFVNTYRAK